MVDASITIHGTAHRGRISAWSQLKSNRNWLGYWFMLPALAILVLFLAYPLGLGVWLSFTDTKIGRAGEFIGLENYEWLQRRLDLLGLGLQHAALHDRRQHHQIRARVFISRCCSTSTCRSRR